MAAIFIASSLIFTQAQAQNIEESLQTPKAEAETREKALKAAQEAEAARVLKDAGKVRYEDVLKDIDNVDLNFQYAQTQISAGDLPGATATLERVLMLDPQRADARLLYGIVLYRLGNLNDALEELEAIRKLNIEMDDALKAQIDDRILYISKKLRRTNWHAVAGVGFQFDSNRNSAPATGTRLLADVPIQLTTGLRRSDTSQLYMLSAGVRRDLGTQEGHKVFANLAYFRGEQTLVDTLDIQVYNFSLGGDLNGGRWGRFIVSAPIDHMRLSEETYLRTYGARLEWENQIAPRLQINSQNQFSKHDYIKTSDIPNALERVGDLGQINVGAKYILVRNQALDFSMGYHIQTARKRYYGYHRVQPSFRHTWILGKGRFLLSSLSWSADTYSGADLAISTQVRRDNLIRANATYGMPMENLFKSLKNLLWTFTFEHFHADSNLTNYGYSNNKVSTMLTYRWDH